jgi:multiple sugar transport system permease protein
VEQSSLKNGTRRRARLGRIITYVLLTLWALIVLFPFYWMLLSSVKSTASYNAELTPSFFTLNPTLENYFAAFRSQDAPLGSYLLNTLLYTVLTTALMMLVIVPAAFAFARLQFRGKNLLFTLFLSLMMIPSELVIITNFATVATLHLNDGPDGSAFRLFLGLILPSATSVFYIYLLKENFEGIPEELYKAAKVDGTSDLKYLLKVMLPISRPTIVTIVILKVIECWNAYVWPRLITAQEKNYLVSNGIQAIRESGSGRANVPAMMAAVVVVSVPLIVLFLVFRDKIMAGVSRGGTKG